MEEEEEEEKGEETPPTYSREAKKLLLFLDLVKAAALKLERLPHSNSRLRKEE